MRRRTVEWQVCGVCNYDCSYCIQSKKARVGHPSDDEVERFLTFFAGLPAGWEIKMTGGEPFAFKGFMGRIVPGLIERTSHTLSTLTNLSAPLGVIERFASLTRGRLGIVSASLHLEFSTVERFLEKALRLRELIDPGARLVVNAVAVPGKLDEVERARERIQAAGLTFFPQWLKIKGGVHAYVEDDKPRLLRIFGSAPTPREANVAPSYRGRACWAGADYFVLIQNGEGYRCRTAKRFSEGYLGNVLDGTLVLRNGPERCTYDICPCTVPANRGMIEGAFEAREGPPSQASAEEVLR